MSTNYSPADPVFYGWHALIDIAAFHAWPFGVASHASASVVRTIRHCYRPVGALRDVKTAIAR
jgi:hypothetical protein